MEQNPDNTNEQEVKDAPTQEVEREQTLGEVLQTTPKEEPKPETVGLDKYLDIKKQNKELKKALEQMKDNIESGDSDVSADMDSIAKEYDVDRTFLNRLENSIRTKMEEKLDQRVSEKLKPIELAEKQKEADKVFNTIYNQALERMSDYESVVDKDVIRSLASLPENSTLSLPQLIEKVYGRTLSGKRTIETTQPRGGKDPQEIDYQLARKDQEYFREIMANPVLKAKYNSNLEGRLDL